VEALRPGAPLFLFNVNDKRMHGIFEAVRGALAEREGRELKQAAANRSGAGLLCLASSRGCRPSRRRLLAA